MHQINLEAILESTIRNVTSPTLVCDSKGRVLGVFSPLREPRDIKELLLEPRLSIAETEELRKKHRSGKPLEEILSRLGY